MKIHTRTDNGTDRHCISGRENPRWSENMYRETTGQTNRNGDRRGKYTYLETTGQTDTKYRQTALYETTDGTNIKTIRRIGSER